MRRGADFTSVLDTLPEHYVNTDETKSRGPFAEYIYTVYSQQVFAELSPFFGKTQCTQVGDMISGYLSHYAF